MASVSVLLKTKFQNENNLECSEPIITDYYDTCGRIICCVTDEYRGYFEVLDVYLGGCWGNHLVHEMYVKKFSDTRLFQS
jgi:hypothetical protein